MNVLIIDGQGGQLGALLVKETLASLSDASIVAVGTNALATSAMLKAGAKQAATGENPVIVACRNADVIIGPIGIVIADALLGEVSEKMAAAVARAKAVRILIPMNKCDNLIAGVGSLSITALVNDAMAKLRGIAEKQ